MRRQVQHSLNSDRKQFGSIGSKNISRGSFSINEITYNINGAKNHKIFSNGGWNRGTIRLKEGDSLNIRVDANVPDHRTKFLFATFSDAHMDRHHGRISTREMLFIRPISPNNGFSNKAGFTVIAPTNVHTLVFYVTDKLPDDVGVRYLDENARKIIGSNGIRAPLTEDAFRSPAFGYKPYNPVVPANVVGDWDGDGPFSTWTGERGKKHTWRKYGWANTDENAQAQTGKSPRAVATANPFLAAKSSLYWYREEEGRRGWEPYPVNAEIPAGAVMMLVVQAFQHDMDVVGYREWHYLDNKFPRDRVWFGPWIPQADGSAGRKKSAFKVSGSRFANSKMDYKVPAGASISLGNNFDKDLFVQDDQGKPFPSDFRREGYPLSDLRAFAYKLEWWNGSMWSQPSIHPPNNVSPDSRGKFTYIFRFPRQLQPDDPIIADAPNWNIEQTSENYPVLRACASDSSKYVLSYAVLGRKEVLLEDGSVGYTSYNNMTAMKSIPFRYYVAPEDDLFNTYHAMFVGKTGFEDLKRVQVITDPQFSYAVTDPVTYARVNNPQLNNVYWKEGTFKPGGQMIIVGQALTMGTTMCISTERDSPKDIRNGTANGVADTLAVDFTITTEQLKDTSAPNEEARVRELWQDTFGTELNTFWFETIGRQGELKGQSPDDPMKYRIKEAGTSYDFPYTITVVTIPGDWKGPKVLFNPPDADGNVTLSQVSAQGVVYFTIETAFAQILTQPIILTEEIEEQRKLIEQGFRPDETMAENPIDAHAYNVTAEELSEETKKRMEEEAAEQQKEKKKGLSLDFWPFKRRKYKTNSWIRSKTFLPFGERIEVDNEGVPMGSIIMNDRYMTIEDVTDKFSADHVTSLDGLGSRVYSDPNWSPKRRGGDVSNFDIKETYLMNGMPTGASIDWFAGVDPAPAKLERKHSPQSHASGTALHARATKRGNPMDASRHFRSGE